MSFFSKRIVIKFPGTLRSSKEGSYRYYTGIPSAVMRLFRFNKIGKTNFNFGIECSTAREAAYRAALIFIALKRMYVGLLDTPCSQWLSILPIDERIKARFTERVLESIGSVSASDYALIENRAKEEASTLASIDSMLHKDVNLMYSKKQKSEEEAAVLNKIITEATRTLKETTDDDDDIKQEFLKWRDIEKPCPTCNGSGILLYQDTSTWRHGIGQQVATVDVCDSCWGTGDAEIIGANLLDLEGILAEQRLSILNLENALKMFQTNSKSNGDIDI